MVIWSGYYHGGNRQGFMQVSYRGGGGAELEIPPSPPPPPSSKVFPLQKMYLPTHTPKLDSPPPVHQQIFFHQEDYHIHKYKIICLFFDLKIAELATCQCTFCSSFLHNLLTQIYLQQTPLHCLFVFIHSILNSIMYMLMFKA